jgi:hypothetical protein
MVTVLVRKLQYTADPNGVKCLIGTIQWLDGGA